MNFKRPFLQPLHRKGRVTFWCRPAFIPAPYFGLRLLFGEFAQVLFASQRVIPRVALDTGFVFQYPEIAAALREILSAAA